MCHVLVIEDDVIAAMDIRDTLASVGATSFAFADTESEAIAAARETRPAVITADVMLSTGSGPSAIRAIAAELGMIPVIFITGTPDQCEGCGPHPIIAKPFATANLAAAFRAVAPS